MDKLGLGLDDETSPQDGPKDPKEQRKASIEKCIRYLVHATKCHDPHCKQPSCIKMKRVLTHTRECKLMLSNKWNMCKICKQFVLLCISHAKNCNEDKCPVPVCARIKKNLRDQRNQQSIQRQRFMQQRMALMNVNSQTTVQNANGGASPATNTSPANPSPAKGSPANYPSNAATNNSPAAITASPAGPQTGGKGGPRTPASEQMTGKAPRMTTASSSPAVQSTPPTAPTGKMEPNMPAPNVTVGATTGLPGELRIQRVPQNPGISGAAMQQRIVGGQMMGRTQPGTQLTPDMMSHNTAGMGGQYGQMNVTSMQQQNMAAMRMQNPGYHPAAAAAQQMMSRQAQYHPQYRGMTPNMQPHMAQQRMMSQSQVYHQQPQQHPRSQLQQMLQAGPPQQQYAPQYGSPQMAAHPHMTRPPPQYPMPQTAGYPQVLGQSRPMAGPSPQMGQHMSTQMHPQYGGMAQMDPSGGMQTADPSSYMYPQQYGLNNNNNNSYHQQDQMGLSAMTPTDRLSRFAESL